MSEHYYTKRPTSVYRENTIKALLRGQNMQFTTASGVFSVKKIDKGSELLVNHCIIEGKEKILDLGCGYGTIGITLAKVFPDVHVVLADINQRAVSLARKNSRKYQLDNIKVKQSDIFAKIKDSFDTILTNPPQMAGKDVCFQFIEGAKEHLNKGGTLQLVARHNKGGRSLSKKDGRGLR